MTAASGRESRPLLLCSASPRRSALLSSAGIPFERGPVPGTDETPPRGLAPDEAAEAIAVRKARAAAASAPGRLVLAADTVVDLDGRILGKPGGAAEAAAMLRALSGRAHRVTTGVALAEDGSVRSGRETAVVVFRALGPDEVERYVATGEGLDKAGGYALQGGAAGFVVEVRGDRDAVVGLPLTLLRRLLGARPRGA
jgi:septum formation protein